MGYNGISIYIYSVVDYRRFEDFFKEGRRMHIRRNTRIAHALRISQFLYIFTSLYISRNFIFKSVTLFCFFRILKIDFMLNSKLKDF